MFVLTSEIFDETDSNEVSMYEDIKKSQRLSKIAEKTELEDLCKNCKYRLENHLKSKISEAEAKDQELDSSISEIKKQLTEIEECSQDFNDKFFTRKDSMTENEKLLKEIKEAKKKIEDLNNEYSRLVHEDIEIQYSLLTDNEKNNEISTRIAVVEDEIKYLKSTGYLLKIFSINSIGKIGTINGMRFGRTDSVLVPWEEINAAFGQCALILSFLFQLKSITSKIINIYPLGAYSRISYLRDDEKRYELFFSDYSYSNLIIRFNKAQQLLLELLQEFEDISKDKKALKEAEDMWEDDEGNTRRDEAGAKKDSAEEAGESRRIEKGEQVMVS